MGAWGRLSQHVAAAPCFEQRPQQPHGVAHRVPAQHPFLEIVQLLLVGVALVRIPRIASARFGWLRVCAAERTAADSISIDFTLRSCDRIHAENAGAAPTTGPVAT